MHTRFEMVNRHPKTKNNYGLLRFAEKTYHHYVKIKKEM